MKYYIKDFNSVLRPLRDHFKKTGELTDNYHDADVFLVWQDVRGDCNELARIVKNHLKKPLVVMQHGRGAVRDYGPPNNFPLLADLILVWGESEKKRLLSYGVPESKIEVVGCPLFSYLRPPHKERTGVNVLFCPVISDKEEPENIMVYAELKKWESDRLIKRIERDFDKMKQGWAHQNNEIKEFVKPDGTMEQRLWKSEVLPTLPRNISYSDGLINAKLTGVHDIHQYQCPVILTNQSDPDHVLHTCAMLRSIDVMVCLEEGTMQLLASALDIPIVMANIFNYGAYGGVKNYDSAIEKIQTKGAYYVNALGRLGPALDFALAHKEDKRMDRIAVCENEGGAHLGSSVDNCVKALERFAHVTV